MFCALFILILMLYIGVFINFMAAIGSYPEDSFGYFVIFLINLVLFIGCLIVAFTMI